ncbi:MAG TPA: DUF2782 domain-containing protein [Sedimenticola sp.]|nr:DUF2782 domain-containing protein [Sedimenticola sp.]
MRKIFGAGLILLLIGSPLAAEEGEEAMEPMIAPEPPEIPPPVQSGEALEPEVTIIKKEKEVIEEYRIEGRLYMVKITPAAGPPYYLLDTDGDGELDTREDSPTNSAIQQWTIFSWD